MKLTLQSIFYALSIFALILFIIQVIDTLMDDDSDDESETVDRQVVLVPWMYHYRPYWRRFRRNVPWFGPRPGGRWLRRRGGRGGRRHRRR